MQNLRTVLTTAMLICLGAGPAAGPAEAQTATIKVSATSAAASEGDRLIFEIGGNWDYNAEIEFRTVDGTATSDADYRGDSGSVCHNPEDDQGNEREYCENGGQKAPCEAAAVHYTDDQVESDETYYMEAWVTRYETGATDANGMPVWRECPSGCGRARVTATIIDNTEEEEPEAEGRVSFTADTASVDEGKSISLTVKFTPKPDTTHGAASVDWTTTDDTATAGRDYNHASDTVRFSACSISCSEQTRTIRVSTRQDEVREPDERFTVNLSNPNNAEMLLHDSQWVLVTIRDDEENGLPRVELIARKTRVEAGGGVELVAEAVDDEGPVESYEWSGAGDFSKVPGAENADWKRIWTAPRPHTPDESARDVGRRAGQRVHAVGLQRRLLLRASRLRLGKLTPPRKPEPPPTAAPEGSRASAETLGRESLQQPEVDEAER